MDNKQSTKLKRIEIKIWGMVQGVGFRPFVAKIAAAHQVKGIVFNEGGNVTIEASGEENELEQFIKAIQILKPETSEIVHMETREIPHVPYETFNITPSREGTGDIVMLPADLSICVECSKELYDEEDKRYLHPFISCMVCGPRYSIIDKVPYDRHYTTMKDFEMCDACKSQYTTLEDRRFHAQTISCHKCGPYLIYRDEKGKECTRELALKKTIEELKKGHIVAIKGIGGYHFACSPFSTNAVNQLRLLKGREEKPFAVMFENSEDTLKYCEMSEEERKLLLTKERPIVLLKRKPSSLVESVYRTSRFLGAFLPYTPLQLLILKETGPLIMTSANVSDQPMIKDEEEMLQVKNPLLRGVLYHQRQISTRIDDSVVKWVAKDLQMIRRSRGYVPVPIYIKGGEIDLEVQLLATGGQLKNSFCITKGNFFYLSQYMGDISDSYSYDIYEKTIERMKRQFRIQPAIICCDLHPNYLTTKYAQETGLKMMEIQHHHAHIASVMAEKGLTEAVIGVAFDGTGYGTDGKIWGGEFLICQRDSFVRAGHLKYVPMLGGDSSIKEAWKTACMVLYASGLEESIKHESWPLMKAAVVHKINTIESSSMGRLFDAISAILDIHQFADYEGECAIRLENAAWEHLEQGGKKEIEPFNFKIFEEKGIQLLDFTQAIREIVSLKTALNEKELAFRFHKTVACSIQEMCKVLRKSAGINTVALSGGVFQNTLLLELTLELLRAEAFEVYTNTLVPPNDGGIALGQAYIGLKTTINPR